MRCADVRWAWVLLVLAAGCERRVEHRAKDAPPAVTLNGQSARLAPGARIRSQQNMVELSGALVGSKYLVHYTLDTSGLVKDVWIRPGQEGLAGFFPNLRWGTVWVPHGVPGLSW